MVSKYPFKKVVVSTGLGKMSQLGDFDKTLYPAVAKALAQITGQKVQDRPAKKSVAGFKLREGTIIGLRATLRRARAHQFLNKLINIVIPRIRDFHGIKLNNIDENGNLNFGIKEHTVFPEIVLEDSKVDFGLQVTLVPQEPMEKEDAIKFYRDLGIPLEKETAEGK
ncbi:MAG: 50S ribosomal protein L5 [bacterium]|nr:50S ribosomal protein L5 [bacterium]